MIVKHIDRVVTDERGQMWAERWIPTPHAGIHSLVMLARDRDGNPAKAETYSLAWRERVIG